MAVNQQTTPASTIRSVKQFLKNAKDLSKRAEPLSNVGQFDGSETSHPSKSVDDGLHESSEGFLSADNDKEVKNLKNPPDATTAPDKSAASKAKKKAEDGGTKGKSQEELANQTGTHKTLTGDDPAVETASVDAGLKDPQGTEHAAATDNSALNGGKYAFDEKTADDKLLQMFEDNGNELLGTLEILHAGGKLASSPPPAATPAPASKVAADPNNDAVYAQYAASYGPLWADLMTGRTTKESADQLVTVELARIAKNAHHTADLTAAFLYRRSKSAAGKRAAGEPPPEEAPPPEAGGDPMAGGGGGDPMAGGGGEEESILNAMGGEDPAAGGGDGDDAAAMAELQQILSKMGMTVGDLVQMLSTGGDAGGAGGGMDPAAMGGAPPPDPAAMGGGDPMAAMGGGGGMDPAAMGGAPPPDPAAMGKMAAIIRNTSKRAAIKNFLLELSKR